MARAIHGLTYGDESIITPNNTGDFWLNLARKITTLLGSMFTFYTNKISTDDDTSDGIVHIVRVDTQESAFENIVCRMGSESSRPQCVNL